MQFAPDANEAALQANLSELDEPVYQGIVAAHSETKVFQMPLNGVAAFPLHANAERWQILHHPDEPRDAAQSAK